jgi:hypothetical protein
MLALATTLRRISSCTNNSILRGACPIIRPSAAAMTQTAIRLRSSTSTAISTQSAERMENTFRFHRRRSSGIETTRTAEIISARLRRVFFALPIPCSASHWEAPREIHPGEWQNAPLNIILREVRSPGQRVLPAGNRDAPHLLRSRLLCGSLQERRPASRKSDQSTMNICSHICCAVPRQQAGPRRSLPAGTSDGLPSPRRTYERDGITDDLCQTISQFDRRRLVRAIEERTLQ